MSDLQNLFPQSPFWAHSVQVILRYVVHCLKLDFLKNCQLIYIAMRALDIDLPTPYQPPKNVKVHTGEKN